MAIVNRTPDSFYDRGATFSDGAAKEATHQKIADGADVIDIGGVKAGPGSTVDADEGIRPGSSVEKLATLKAPFIENGVITAGNASQISDGAAALLLAGVGGVLYGLEMQSFPIFFASFLALFCATGITTGLLFEGVQPVAGGLCVLDRDLAGIFALRTAVHARGKGHGSAVARPEQGGCHGNKTNRGPWTG